MINERIGVLCRIDLPVGITGHHQHALLPLFYVPVIGREDVCFRSPGYHAGHEVVVLVQVYDGIEENAGLHELFLYARTAVVVPVVCCVRVGGRDGHFVGTKLDVERKVRHFHHLGGKAHILRRSDDGARFRVDLHDDNPVPEAGHQVFQLDFARALIAEDIGITAHVFQVIFPCPVPVFVPAQLHPGQFHGRLVKDVGVFVEQRNRIISPRVGGRDVQPRLGAGHLGDFQVKRARFRKRPVLGAAQHGQH